MELDLKDRKILYELEMNARQTDSEIAKKVRLSREVVSYRINRLKKLGIIKNFVTILNHHALGYLAFRIFFKFRDLSGKKEEEIVRFLKDKVGWLVRVRGDWSFNCMIFTKNIFAVESFINSLKEKFQDNFMDMDFSLITRIYHYRRSYLMNMKKDSSKFDLMGEIVDTTNLDKIDLDILGVIENNGRLSSIEVAHKINKSERIVRYRLQSLIKKKVILGFRASLNLGKLGYSYYKVHFKLNKFQKKILDKIEDYAHLHPNIVYKTDTIGGPDLELEIQVRSNRELYEIIENFISEFEGVVEDYDILEYDEEYKMSYLNQI